jgi:hypothetical protein
MQMQQAGSLEIDRVLDRPAVTDQEVAAFERDGFVLPERGLSPEDTAELQEVSERVFRDNADLPSLIRMPHVPRREGQLEGVTHGEELFRFAVHPLILAAARRLIGPDLIMWGGEIFSKAPRIGRRTPWHQDCYNPSVKAGPGRDQARSVMIWIAIDYCDPGNGCLRYIPGSGANGPIPHEQFEKTAALLNFEADLAAFDPSTAVDSIRAPGQYSGHDFFVVHGAEPNDSDRRRAGVTFHYMSAEDHYDRSFGDAKGSGLSAPAPLSRRPIWLVLGENRCPGNDFKTGHQNLEDLDVLAEEARRTMTPLLS